MNKLYSYKGISDLVKNKKPFKVTISGITKLNTEEDYNFYLIKSYGYYPIALYNKRENLWYKTDDLYSPTTSNQYKRLFISNAIEVPHKKFITMIPYNMR